MKLTIIRRSACEVNDWSGGGTVQLTIYPPEAQYKKRNFKYRLSTAFSTKEGDSPFTELPGIYRHLMILEGGMRVWHEGHGDITLTPYCEVDSFEGEWKSRSAGKARDFNLMLGAGCSGRLTPLLASTEAVVNDEYTHTAFFCGEGTATIHTPEGEEVVVGVEDMALIDDIRGAGTVRVTLSPGAKLVRADIRLP